MKRVTDPDLHDANSSAPEGVTPVPLQGQVQQMAEDLLKKFSTVEYTISYSHAYCPVRVGDCVRLDYTRAELTGINAKVVSQAIKCSPDCPVSEKAVYSAKLWR